MKTGLLSWILMFLFVLAGSACSSDEQGPGFDGGPNPDGQDGSNSSDDSTQTNDDQTNPADKPNTGGDLPICDEMEIESHAVPPNMLLVVDKSGSMDDPTVQGGARKKIQDLKDAVNQLLDEGEGSINFGWMQFPGNSDCRAGSVSVQIGSPISNIKTKLLILSASGGTPTGGSLENADSYFSDLQDQQGRNFVLLITDGLPTCPKGNGSEVTEQDSQLAVDAVTQLRTNNVETFVIGLGEGVNQSNPELLNEMAEEGGWARPGNVKYYQANSLVDLQQVLDDIGGMVIGCNIALTVTPEFPSYLWVFFDGVKVDRDKTHQNGWDYDSNRNAVDFYGATCDQLRSGEVTKVDVKMGCAPPD